MPLITNGGDHSAETLAMHTAGMLLPDEPGKGHELERGQARIAIARALMAHHDGARASETGREAAFDDPIAVDDLAAAALADIREVVAGTSFAGQFGGDHEASALATLRLAFSTTAHTARQHAAKAHGSDEAKAFIAQHHA